MLHTRYSSFISINFIANLAVIVPVTILVQIVKRQLRSSLDIFLGKESQLINPWIPSCQTHSIDSTIWFTAVINESCGPTKVLTIHNVAIFTEELCDAVGLGG
jgi:hypothetical protein